MTSSSVTAAVIHAELMRGLGRDSVSYSSRNSSQGALITESRAILRALAGGSTLEEVHRAVLEGKLLRQRARETRRHIWTALSWRLFAWNPPAWVLSDLCKAARDDDTYFKALLYIHYARRDRLTFNFVVEKLAGMRVVARGDVLDFLAEREQREPAIRRWRESTRVKLAGNVLTALRDFGVLAGVQRKRVQRPVVLPEAVLHLSRLLYAEGLRGRAVLEAPDWRLFLWEYSDTAAALGNLAQQGRIRFEKSGQTVILEMNGEGAAE